MIDLHVHTNHSDGSDTVTQVLTKAEELGLKYLSITDHDTISAYKQISGLDLEKFYTGKLIKGIEIKCSVR